VLERLDLEAKLNATHALLRGIGTEEEPLVTTNLGKSGMKDSFLVVNGQSALSVCMSNVNDAVEKIHQDLTEIHLAVEEHKKKWFNGWRGVTYGVHLDQLETHKLVFDSRLETLMKFLMLPRDVVTYRGSKAVTRAQLAIKADPQFVSPLVGGQAAAYGRHSSNNEQQQHGVITPPTFCYDGP
jgi:hypothetical protein